MPNSQHDKHKIEMFCRRRIEEKNRLLRSMGAGSGGSLTGSGVSMAELDNTWEAFTSQLQQHESHLEEQKNQLQGQVARQVRGMWCGILVRTPHMSFCSAYFSPQLALPDLILMTVT